MAATANAEVSASTDLSVAAGDTWAGSIKMGLEAAEKTDVGERVATWGEAALKGAAAGAAAGTLCGPFAPVCSAVGAVVGALISLGLEIAKMWEGIMPSKPCRAWDFGPVMRTCAETLTSSTPVIWTVGPQPGLEKLLWNTPIAGAPRGLTAGFMFWVIRRSREDNLGLDYVNKLLQIGGMPVPVAPTAEQIAQEAKRLAETDPLKGRTPVTPAMWRGVAAARAGANLFGMYQAAGMKPSNAAIARYQRSRAMVESEFTRRFGRAGAVKPSTPTPPSVAASAGGLWGYLQAHRGRATALAALGAYTLYRIAK